MAPIPCGTRTGLHRLTPAAEIPRSFTLANIAQLVEQRFRKAWVVGSIPTVGSSAVIGNQAGGLEDTCQKSLDSGPNPPRLTPSPCQSSDGINRRSVLPRVAFVLALVAAPLRAAETKISSPRFAKALWRYARHRPPRVPSTPPGEAMNDAISRPRPGLDGAQRVAEALQRGVIRDWQPWQRRIERR